MRAQINRKAGNENCFLAQAFNAATVLFYRPAILQEGCSPRTRPLYHSPPGLSPRSTPLLRAGMLLLSPTAPSANVPIL